MLHCWHTALGKFGTVDAVSKFVRHLRVVPNGRRRITWVWRVSHAGTTIDKYIRRAAAEEEGKLRVIGPRESSASEI